MIIRTATQADLDQVLDVESRAFGSAVEAALVRDLLTDPSAAPTLSLIALDEAEPIGHILFTKASIDGQDRPVSSLLAPLAIVPDRQRTGVGRALVAEGLARLATDGVSLVFVLGDPAYYGRFGFSPAIPEGLDPPHELPEAYRDAWMVRSTCESALRDAAGTVRCADAIMRPEYWA
ncbi:GNAT family N-acetyltransferase [Amorphus coralli]|uniref:GNAT family N-acetyltransferase n=1 Tax=Amorphus coralli TaxID=340680 RepID=UPI000367F019|nr:N-acetyltransferase [Amorphus coralli]